jgi:proteasome lid subunit RPN8/RPN11
VDTGSDRRMQGLTIPARLLVELERIARDTYPEECCGALVGRSGAVMKLWPTPNVHRGARSDRYMIDPRDLLQAHHLARRMDSEVIGYYHSHPDRPAVPSETDLAAAVPGASYLILAVSDKQVTDRRCWRLRPEMHDFVEEKIL